MSDPSPSGPFRLASSDGSLVAEFRWQNDRFVHRVVTADGDELSSIEGQADQAWPPSPPLQQLSPQSIGEKDLIFGVGLAGQSHWSVSVEIAEQEGRPAVKFDWACRCKQTPEQLASTYSIAAGFEIQPSAGTVQRFSGDGQLHLEPAEYEGPGTHQWTYQIAAKY